MSEYKPLHELILEGLEEGTVLEPNSGDKATWKNGELLRDIYPVAHPFSFQWRISTPPKKIEFEAVAVCLVKGSEYLYVQIPIDSGLSERRLLRVTVEEKR